MCLIKHNLAHPDLMNDHKSMQAQPNPELSQTCFHSLYNAVFLFQLQRRGSTMSTLSSVGRLGHFEVKGLLLCFLHIVKTVSEGQYPTTLFACIMPNLSCMSVQI